MSTTSLERPIDPQAHLSLAVKQLAGVLAEAQTARQQALTSGQGYVAEEVHQYLRDKIAGRTMQKPSARFWRA